MRLAVLPGLTALVLTILTPTSAHAEQLPQKYKKAIKKGLEWVAKTQKPDGSWSAASGQYPVAMTALGGMSLLMEGSTVRQGKYAKNIKRAVGWLMQRAQPNGMIGNPRNRLEAARYMYGHGFGLMFLSCAYGGETDIERRKELQEILEKAAEFTFKAQTSRGGWGYVSAKDGNGFDEGSVTITQVQALRAARNAGIKVPAKAIENSVRYLEKSTTNDGGVIYSLANSGGVARGTGRPALTAAAISCGFSAGNYDAPIVKKWFKFCESHIPSGTRIGHYEYTHYYYAQAVYALGDKGWKKLFPKDKKGLVWSAYRKQMFDSLVGSQTAEGYWNGRIGPIYVTSLYLTILQLDKGSLPIYQR